MQELVKNYPSLISRAYILIENNEQKKDIQRFWFENTISFLAIVASANLVQEYNKVKIKENLTSDDEKIITTLQNHPSLTNIGFEHMSLGKWVGCLRESIKAFENVKFKNTLMTALSKFYKESEKSINNLVTIRNADAHGEPIAKDKLDDELSKRQALIDNIVNSLSFLSNYELILPEKLQIEDGDAFYLSKIFKGNETINTKISFPFNIQAGEVILCDKEKKEVISLTPYILYLGLEHSDKPFLGLFSSYSNKEQTIGKYLNLDGNANIDFNNFSKIINSDLFKTRQSFVEIYSDPEKYSPNFDIKLKFNEDRVEVNKESSFELILDNKKSIDLHNLNISINIPSNMEIISEDITFKDARLNFSIDALSDDEIKKEIKFKIKEQGSYFLNSGICEFEYYDSDANKEIEKITQSSVELNGAEVECFDPNSRDKMLPVININRNFLDENGKTISNIKIGDKFIFSLSIKNIGFSSAKNVMIDLIFPQNLNLEDGKETIILSELNPNEIKTFQYVLYSKVPDIYNLSMQNVTYSDLNDTKYSTQCADDYYIIVRSDIKKEFSYRIEEFLEDLYIDEEELIVIDKEIEKLSQIDENAKEFYEKSETNAVIQNLRKMILKSASKQELEVREFIYEEGNRDSKITNEERRKFLVFAIGRFPFFAINLSKRYNPTFHSICSNIDKIKGYEVKKGFAVVENSYTLDYYIDYADIKYDEKYGRSFFSTWIGQSLNRMQNQYLKWNEITNKIDHFFNKSNNQFKYLSGKLFKEMESNEVDTEGSISEITTFLNRIENKLYISYKNASSSTYKKMIKEFQEKNDDIVFINNGIHSRDYYDGESLSYYETYTNENKVSSRVSVVKKITKKFDSEDLLNEAKNLWYKLCHIHSYELLEEILKDKVDVEKFSIFIDKLYEKGFALRENKKYPNKIIEIYPMKYFNPHQADYKDIVCFLIIGRKLRFDFRIYDSSLHHEKLKLQKSVLITTTIFSPSITIEEEEDLDIATELMLKNIEKYTPNKNSIIPKEMQKDFLIQIGQYEDGFFELCKVITLDVTNIEELNNIFIENNFNDGEAYKFIKRLDKIALELNIVEPFFFYDDESIEINPIYEDTIQLMKEEKENFEFFEQDSLVYKKRLVKEVSKNYKPLYSRNPHTQTGELYIFKNIKNNYFKRYCKTISIKKDKLAIEMILQECDPNKIEELNDIFNFDEVNEFYFKEKNNFYFIYREYDFDTNIEILQDSCKEFYETVDFLLEGLN